MDRVIERTRRIAVLDGHRLSDRAVDRLAMAAASLVLFSTDALFDATDRFRALRPDIEVLDGGLLKGGGVREAIVAEAEAGCVLLAVAEPIQRRRFLHQAVNGAIDAGERGHPTVAVLIMRPREVPGDVAVFSNTGEASGYGLAFALEIAMRRGVDVARILPTKGLYVRRTAEVGHKADVEAGGYGVKVRYRKVARPLETVLRGQYTLAVHSVLDVIGRRSTRAEPGAPARLQHDANVDAVLWLLRFFRGDVLLVGDTVRLRQPRERDAVVVEPTV
ncbi:hypothetical protein QQX13_01380 [Demequina sp. SYSU T00068]|uniref:hypothetical protein n=1 Tax=Demequina lignilytica TaxID=3051663 RepID=UPI002639EC3A|nr:hypothetical protein [Demequina sp. SYSU T00068]MDN4489473.1 hypothetical protein [Demequina sp. SYSU T00068]